MQKILLSVVIMFAGNAFSYAIEGGCHHCEVIREENKKKVNKYKYYEDYLKDHPEEKQSPQKDSEKEKETLKDVNG